MYLNDRESTANIDFHFTNKLKLTNMESMNDENQLYRANTAQRKGDITRLLSAKTDFRARKITKDTTILNVYAPNKRAAKS